MVGTDDFDVGKQYAVIIGIDKYEEWPSLRSAAAEARDVRRLCLDVLPRKVGLKDSLLIFYAGHGYLDDSKTGFWIASDGTKDVYSQQGWIPNAQLRNYIAGLKVQRVLLIADACFSGDFLNVTRGAGPTVDTAYFRKALKLTARQVLTSGASETVPDESEFGRQLISLLERNSDSVLDPHTMFDRIRRGVNKTEPLIGTIPGNETGATFALFLKPTTGSLSVAASTEADVYVDGKKRARVLPGKPVVVPNLPPRERRLVLRYASSSEETRIPSSRARRMPTTPSRSAPFRRVPTSCVWRGPGTRKAKSRCSCPPAGMSYACPGSGWEYGNLSTPEFYVDFRK